MDELVAKVKEKLDLRQAQSIELTYSQRVPSEEVFIDNANVDIMTTPLELIVDMFKINFENDWVRWIAKGFEYDINFRFEVSTQISKFIPLRMIRDWPCLFVVDAIRPMYVIDGSHITRGDIASKPDKAIIVLTNKQKLTSDAEDIVSYKDIQLQVRNDEECIWQK